MTQVIPEVQIFKAWMEEDMGGDAADHREIHAAVYGGKWIVWMESIESSSSWHGCGIGRSFEAALADVKDHMGASCRCNRAIRKHLNVPIKKR